MSGWRFNGSDWQWQVRHLAVANMIYLDFTKDGQRVGLAAGGETKVWLKGIVENLEGWTQEQRQLDDPAFVQPALNLLKETPEDEVLDALLAYIRSKRDFILQQWRNLSGDTDAESPAFESALEALTALVNRDLLPPPSQL